MTRGHIDARARREASQWDLAPHLAVEALEERGGGSVLSEKLKVLIVHVHVIVRQLRKCRRARGALPLRAPSRSGCWSCRGRGGQCAAPGCACRTSRSACVTHVTTRPAHVAPGARQRPRAARGPGAGRTSRAASLAFFPIPVVFFQSVNMVWIPASGRADASEARPGAPGGLTGARVPEPGPHEERRPAAARPPQYGYARVRAGIASRGTSVSREAAVQP